MFRSKSQNKITTTENVESFFSSSNQTNRSILLSSFASATAAITAEVLISNFYDYNKFREQRNRKKNARSGESLIPKIELCSKEMKRSNVVTVYFMFFLPIFFTYDTIGAISLAQLLKHKIKR